VNSFANVPLCEAMRQDFVAAQAKADQVAQAFNDSAPRWLSGERLIDYRRRLLEPLKQHSPAWRSVDIPRAEDVLRVAESQIYADAAREASNPSNIPAGTLLERITTDQSGRRISRFHGDVEAFLGPFKLPAMQVISIGRRS
jgi:hypothetical protein